VTILIAPGGLVAAHFLACGNNFKQQSPRKHMDAYNNPDFYRQLGKDPGQLMAAVFDRLSVLFDKFRAGVSFEVLTCDRV
jgi:hypothetical protein